MDLGGEGAFNTSSCYNASEAVDICCNQRTMTNESMNAELRDRISAFRVNLVEYYQSSIYYQTDFRHIQPPQCIMVHLNEEKAYYSSNVLAFWLASLIGFLEDSGAGPGLFDRYAPMSRCHQISELELHRRATKWLDNLKQSVSFHYKGKFLQAFLMLDVPEIQAMVGESDKQFFAIYLGQDNWK